MNRWPVLGSLALVVAAGACKGKEVVKPDPETEAALADCRSKAKDQDELRKLLEKEIADLKLGSTTGGEVVVSIEGSVLDIKLGRDKGPYQGEPKGNAQDEQLYEKFVEEVRGSRAHIKKCYQSALKKDSKLQARTITLNIQVNFGTSGKMTSASFTPNLSGAFDKCMTNVADRWKLPAAPKKVAFQYKMSLTPE